MDSKQFTFSMIFHFFFYFFFSNFILFMDHYFMNIPPQHYVLYSIVAREHKFNKMSIWCVVIIIFRCLCCLFWYFWWEMWPISFGFCVSSEKLVNLCRLIFVFVFGFFSTNMFIIVSRPTICDFEHENYFNIYDVF